ncbi:MAG TPA: HlyD family type I secretion periplasmic adaptor subunit [Terriglobales bacterium]|nr:HlyD family type I secretion periplasmic adaptor subunit [Terriglobales bacterium]
MVFRHAWRERRQFDTPHRLSHEAEFLPAALALQETPVSPAPRATMWLLMLFSFCALLWAIFGWVDIVATASGKLVPNDRTKVIQPMETAVIRAIYVTDGQPVKPGDVLVELDDTTATADTLRLANDLTAARLQAARARGLLAAITQGAAPKIEGIEGIDSARVAQEQRVLEGEHAELSARLAQLDADKTKREAELRSTQEIVRKLEQTAPIARQRAEDFKGLVEKNFVARHGYLEREQARIEQEADLASQRSRLNELMAALQEAKHQKTTLIAETRRATLDSLNEAEQKSVAARQELVKAETRAKLMKLTAPVEGEVQQLAVHTVGGVVTPAQPLMMIVPKDNPLEIEAFVENKDIGFVNPGQEAEIKIETFPFTKYGTLHGQITQVSNDAINDEKRGLIYSARVQPERNTMQVEGKTVNLSPGMAVTVEFKTGKRRVIEYFLSPLIQHASESLHER